MSSHINPSFLQLQALCFDTEDAGGRGEAMVQRDEDAAGFFNDRQMQRIAGAQSGRILVRETRGPSKFGPCDRQDEERLVHQFKKSA
jgi:hypothetical protein